MNLRRIKCVAQKELIQIWRDPRSLALALGIPIFLLFLFGYGLSLDIDHVHTVVWDRDAGSALTREFLNNFAYSRYFKIIRYVDNYRDIEQMIDSGQALMAIIVPKDFSRFIRDGEPAPLQLIIDGSDANTATIARGYVHTVIANYNVYLLDKTLAARGLQKPRSIDSRPRVWFNMGLNSTWFIVPGVIAIIIMIVASLVTSLCIAREWERGTMEQLISTPVKAPELVIGKFLPYFAIGLFDLTVGVVVGTTIFAVPFRGNYILLAVLSSLFLTGALAQGILISIVARTQLMASQLASLTTMIPAIILSGFVYPIFNMPKALQLITYLVPARYYIVILRQLFLKGTGLKTMWEESLFLFIFGMVMLFFAITKFKKKVAIHV